MFYLNIKFNFQEKVYHEKVLNFHIKIHSLQGTVRARDEKVLFSVIFLPRQELL